MSCCVPGGIPGHPEAQGFGPSQEEVLLASHRLGNGLLQSEISVPTIHCGGCIRSIEQGLGPLPGLVRARVNLSSKRLVVHWQEGMFPPVFEALDRLGYPAHLSDAQLQDSDPVLTRLLRALAVSGFAAGNVMLFSMSVWAGADQESRDLFHWLSALVAVPAAAYSGQVFFQSAWQALRHGRTNMDVPISIGVLLAFGMSLYDTATHGPHAYFDAAVSLLFFLLIGRVLDHVMRERARHAVKGLARLSPRGAVVKHSDGSHEYLPVDALQKGMNLVVAAGERISVDCRVVSGESEVDCSLVTGESMPLASKVGTLLQAGALNLTSPLEVQATATAKDSFLAEMLRLMEAAEAGRTGYRRIADRAAQLYAPVVHLAAFASFVGWFILDGNAHHALAIAVAVLIITCPCALALAVPMVQVVAARRLFESGIMAKDGSAFEKIAQVDTVVFDKTGTLTLGQLTLSNRGELTSDDLSLAAAIAIHSRHPRSQAIVRACSAARVRFAAISEFAGLGLEAVTGDRTFRLGRSEWALRDETPGLGTVLTENGELRAKFEFEDRLRPDARVTIENLQSRGFQVVIMSGDREDAVRITATALGISEWHGGMLPGDKSRQLAALSAEGHKVLMVGDGLNDGPALRTAFSSMAPATAADIGRNAADFVFLRDSLTALPQTLDIASESGRLIRQNFVLALGYNAVALPFAILGQITPLIAALVMSSSSIIVVANALRLNRRARIYATPRVPSSMTSIGAS